MCRYEIEAHLNQELWLCPVDPFTVPLKVLLGLFFPCSTRAKRTAKIELLGKGDSITFKGTFEGTSRV